MKNRYKPLQYLADWKRCIVSQLPNVDPIREEPCLMLMRDTRSLVRNEKKVKHIYKGRVTCIVNANQSESKP